MRTSLVATERLRTFMERIEKLEEDKQGVNEDIKQVYLEAKGEGYDTKVMRMIVRLRKLDGAARQELDAVLDLYRSALGI